MQIRPWLWPAEGITCSSQPEHQLGMYYNARRRAKEVLLNAATLLSLFAIAMVVYPAQAKAAIPFPDPRYNWLIDFTYTYTKNKPLYINLMNPSEQNSVIMNLNESADVFEKLDVQANSAHELRFRYYIYQKGYANFNDSEPGCTRVTCKAKVVLKKGSTTVAERSLAFTRQSYYNGSIYVTEAATSASISLNGLEEGQYTLTTEVYYAWSSDLSSSNFSQKIVNTSITVYVFYATSYPEKTYNYGSPGEEVPVTLRVRGQHIGVAASLYDVQNEKWISIAPPIKKADEDTPFGKESKESVYEVKYRIPEDVDRGSIYEVIFRTSFPGGSSQDVVTYIVVGEDPEKASPEPPPEISQVCPFLANPVYGYSGQMTDIGCYDNPSDEFQVIEGTVFLQDGGTKQLERSGKDGNELVTSIRVPMDEGMYNIVYNLKVQNTRGHVFTVSGTQQLVAISNPEDLYCPPPADGVTSAPGSRESVGVRLFR